MKVRDVIKEIVADGWFFVRMRGDHRFYEHPKKKGGVTVAGQPGDDVPIGTLKKIYKQAQIRRK